MDQPLALLVVAILGGGVTTAIKALFDLRPMRSKANADDASGTSMVVAAARELVDPLRAELAAERADHATEVAVERQKVAEVRAELNSALAEAKELRNELAMARVEADALRREREVDRARIRELEAEKKGSR